MVSWGMGSYSMADEVDGDRWSMLSECSMLLPYRAANCLRHDGRRNPVSSCRNLMHTLWNYLLAYIAATRLQHESTWTRQATKPSKNHITHRRMSIWNDSQNNLT